MATDHRRAQAELVQGPLLDDPAFLKEIVQRVVQELLEAEMIPEHIGAAPTSEPRGALGSATDTSPER